MIKGVSFELKQTISIIQFIQEQLDDVEKRIKSFLDFLLENYNNKHIGIVAHKAPQLAIEVLTQNKTWEKAIAEDWRKTKAWQPGWNYNVETK